MKEDPLGPQGVWSPEADTTSRFGVFSVYARGMSRLLSAGPVQPVWSPDGSFLAYVTGPVDARIAWRIDLATGASTPLLDVDRARAAIALVTGETPSGQGLPFDRFMFSGADEIRFSVGMMRCALDLRSYRAAEVIESPVEKEWNGLWHSRTAEVHTYLRSSRLTNPRDELEVPSPDGTYLLSTRDHNIVVRSATDGRTLRLTNDGVTGNEWRFDAPYSLPTAPHAGGTAVCWSPDSRKAAAYKVDLHGVYRAPQVHHLKTVDEIVFRPFARAGGVLERTTLFVLDLYGRSPVELGLGDTTDTHPVCVTWLPDSSGLLVVQLSRDCTQAAVMEADAATGRVRSLFTETGESFVRTHHDFYYPATGQADLGLWVTPDGDRIIWRSERSGWRHFYLYDRNGALLRQLTSGEWPVEEVIAVRDGYVYFTGHRDQTRPYDLHFYRVPLAGGEVEALTDGPGVHTVTLAPSGATFLDAHSTVARPPTVDLRTSEGRRIVEVSRTDISRLEAIGWVPPEEFTVTAADGRTELWGVLFKPHDFDSAKTYPLIEYIYGGPSDAMAPHGFIEGKTPHTFGAVAAQALAQLGYITVMVDGRGTPGRSKAFHDASYLRWANVLADDHAEAIGQLAERYEFIRGGGAGVIGHSWGGYSALRCLADRPDVYGAAVCSAPGLDPHSAILYECYLNLPQRNPTGYAFADVIPLAAKIKGAVMLAAGTCDHGTWTDAIKMSEALIRVGKLHEFVVLPEQYHLYTGIHDAYFWRKAAAFFARHLVDELGAGR